MSSKALLVQAWAVSSAYRYASTPPILRADQVISDFFGGQFCGDQDGTCTVRAPGAKAPLVTQLLRNASDVDAYATGELIRSRGKTPVFWVPLGHATMTGAFGGICAFVTRLAPALAKAKTIEGFTLLTLPYPVGEHGSPWDHAYVRMKQYPPCGFDKLKQILDAPKLRAWFVLDHDRHEGSAWVLHPKLRHVPMGLAKGFPALKSGLAQLAKQHKPRSVDVYANFHVHAERSVAGARSIALAVAARNFKALNRMKKIAKRNATCALEADGAPCTREEHYVEELFKARYVLSPPGSQLDCHRHWETLVFGAVPIVHSSPITRALLAGLPVCFVPAWDALTPDVLKRCDARLAGTRFDWDRLTVDYWRKEISESKASVPKAKPSAKADAADVALQWTKDRNSLIETRKAGRWAALLQNYSRVQKAERAKGIKGKYVVAFARIHGHASRIATITATLALAMASGRALAVVWPRRQSCRGRDHVWDRECDPAGITDLLSPNLVDFGMPPFVQQRLLAKGGCGHETRDGDWVVRDKRDEKMFLEVYHADLTWTPPVVCTAGRDDWSWVATCRLGGASPLADAGALQDFLFKPSAAVLKRIGASLASSGRPCDLGIHLLAADRTTEWGHKEGDTSWLRIVAEAIARQKAFVADGKRLDYAIFVAADRGSQRTKTLLQDAFGEAVIFMDGNGVSPGRDTVEGNVEVLAENYVLSTCAEILPAGTGRNSAFRSIAAARAAFEQAWSTNRSRTFVEGGKHSSGGPAACADL